MSKANEALQQTKKNTSLGKTRMCKMPLFGMDKGISSQLSNRKHICKTILEKEKGSYKVGIKLNTCKGICQRYRATKPVGGRYVDGQKRCSNCEIFIWWEEKHCPCCGTRLRTKVRNRSQQEKLKWRKLSSSDILINYHIESPVMLTIKKDGMNKKT